MNGMIKLRDTYKTAEQAGHWIIERSPDSPSIVSEVNSDLGEVKKDIDDLDNELVELKQQYQLSILESEPVDGVVEDFAKWLTDVDRKLMKAKPLSAAYPEVSKEDEKLQVK